MGKNYTESIAGANIAKLSDFIKILTQAKGGKILDVGCAGGRDSKKLTEAGFEVTGIDLVEVFLEIARISVPAANFIKMNLLNLGFPDDYFDGIWANAVLLHLRKQDVPIALNNFYRVLKCGGKLYIGVKRGRGEKYVEERLSGGEKRFFSYFYKNEFEDFLRNAGFRLISSTMSSDSLGRNSLKWIELLAEKR